MVILTPQANHAPALTPRRKYLADKSNKENSAPPNSNLRSLLKPINNLNLQSQSTAPIYNPNLQPPPTPTTAHRPTVASVPVTTQPTQANLPDPKKPKPNQPTQETYPPNLQSTSDLHRLDTSPAEGTPLSTPTSTTMLCQDSRSRLRPTTYRREQTRDEMHEESRSPPRNNQPTTLSPYNLFGKLLPSKEDLEMKSSKTHGRIQTFGRETQPANKMHPHIFSPAGSSCDEIEKRNASL